MSKYNGGTNMNILIQPEVLRDLKEELESLNKNTLRFDIAKFGWSGPIFDIVLDEQKENDTVVEVEGIKFVADSDIAPIIINPEIIKTENGFTVKKTGCCG